jgi:DNA-binding NarL/FixJ family response regulator
VVGEAPPADEGLEKVADLIPTVVVMNVHTPGLDGAGAS